MTISDLTEECISSETMVTGRLLSVNSDQVRLANGHVTQREYVLHPGAVVIIPLLANGNVILERQFRYPLRQVFIELPAGKIDANENMLHAGQRELLEETGYEASEWVRLGQTHPCIGYSNEVIQPHGFRHTAATMLAEMSWNTDAIDRQLAHKEQGVKGVYQKAQYLEERTRMMQAWADYADGLKLGAQIIPIKAA